MAKKFAEEKLRDAFIDMSVTCMGCGQVLWSGTYEPGVVGKLRKKIHAAGWKHHSSEGTLCPDCLKKFEAGEKYEEFGGNSYLNPDDYFGGK